MAVMTMSKFRVAPRIGHLNRLRQIVGYLAKMQHAMICFRTKKPDFLSLVGLEYDWENLSTVKPQRSYQTTVLNLQGSQSLCQHILTPIFFMTPQQEERLLVYYTLLTKH